MFFLFSLLSFIFSPLPLIFFKLSFTTCETYAMWLILELPNLLYSLPHHRPHMFLSFIVLDYISHPCFWRVNNDQPHSLNVFCSISNRRIYHLFYFLHTPPLSRLLSFYLWLISVLHHHSLHRPSLNTVELVFPPSLPSVLQSTCDTLRSHSDSLGFTPNMLPRHPTLGNFEEFACWQHKVGVGGGAAHLGTWQQTVK